MGLETFPKNDCRLQPQRASQRLGCSREGDENFGLTESHAVGAVDQKTIQDAQTALTQALDNQKKGDLADQQAVSAARNDVNSAERFRYASCAFGLNSIAFR